MIEFRAIVVLVGRRNRCCPGGESHRLKRIRESVERTICEQLVVSIPDDSAVVARRVRPQVETGICRQERRIAGQEVIDLRKRKQRALVSPRLSFAAWGVKDVKQMERRCHAFEHATEDGGIAVRNSGNETHSGLEHGRMDMGNPFAIDQMPESIHVSVRTHPNLPFNIAHAARKPCASPPAGRPGRSLSFHAYTSRCAHGIAAGTKRSR